MAAPTSAVQRQVARASRRLFVQTLLDTTVWCWAIALLASALWFLLQPWILSQFDEWLRWTVAGGVFAVATGAAVWLAARWAPSHVEAAVELDQRFKLKERVTSSLTLAPELLVTSAGQALLADAETHADKLHVGSRFPVRLSWNAALVPGAAALLALIAVFYNPVFDASLAADRTKDEIKLVNAKEIEQKFNNLKKPNALKWPKDEKNPELEEIEKLRDKLFNEPLDPNNRDQIREKLQQMVPLEDRVKQRMDDLKAQEERNKEMQKKLQEMGKNPDQQLQQDGPGKDAQDALNQGDLDKAQQEMKALADMLKNNQFNEEDRKKLEKQLADMKDKLGDLADQKQLRKMLEKALAEGRLSKEDFDKLLAQAEENAEKLKDLKDLGKQLGDVQDALEKGDAMIAADKLAEAAKELRKLDPNGEEMQMLLLERQRLMELRLAMQQGLGQPNAPPGGERKSAKEHDKVGAKDERQKAELNADTQFRVEGTQKGGKFNKIPNGQVGGAFVQAQQDAPEAIERQQIPPDAADFLKGYYENLGGGKKK